MHQVQAERYLQRKSRGPAPSIIQWLTCCTSVPASPEQKRKELKMTSRVSKRPLKQRQTTHPSSAIDSKENARAATEGMRTERPPVTGNGNGVMKLSLFAGEQKGEAMGEGERLRKQCKVRFSYVEPHCRRSTIHQVNLDSILLPNTQTKERFKPSMQDSIPQETNNEAVELPSGPLLLKTDGSKGSSDMSSPRSMQRKESVQSPTLKRKKVPGRFSLRMRQVQSIRQPQEESDHESVVEDSLGIFGLLVPIREVDRESRVGDSRVGNSSINRSVDFE